MTLDDLENGKGFSVLRGLSISDVGRNDIESLFWGIVNHFGTPISQNSKGECLGHVTDLGLDANDNKVANINMLWDNVIISFQVNTMPEEFLKKFAKTLE